jgi:SAM-dependent methyltransferase
MDRADVDPRHLAAALRHVAGVNRWLGARRALLRHLPAALPARRATTPAPRPARVLDVGTGSADLPLALAGWARTRRPLEITAVDRHPETLRVARTRTASARSIRLVRGDGLALPFADGAFDLALLSMTLHHMDGDDLVDLLRELRRVAGGGRVLVGELERALPHYLGARLLAATLWRGNPVTRHDGPLSVRRGFTPDELLDLARRAGLTGARVHRHLFYRLVLLADA